jgi:hypothetical protein
MKENLRRIRTLNSLHEDCQLYNTYNECDEYFPNQN